MKSVNRLGTLCAVLGSCFAAACGREGGGTYSVPKEESTRSLPAAKPGAPETPAAPPVVRWTVPLGWFEKPGDPMRVGSFAVTNAAGQSADISVVPLAGTGGSELGNVNRWRGQVGLGPITEQELPAQWEKVAIGTNSGRLADLVGKGEKQEQTPRMLAAMLPQDGLTWFFKMVGEKSFVGEQKPAFLAFLQSVGFGASGASSGQGAERALPAGHPPLEGVALGSSLPPGHPAISVAAGTSNSPLPVGHPPLTNASPVTQPGASIPVATGPLPPGWTQEAPKPMQSARYLIKDGAQEAEVSVTDLAGEAGGVLANVNRWRQQLGLQELSQEAYAKTAASVDVGGTKAVLVDIANEAQHKRLVALILPRTGQTVFYKMLGDDALAERQKEAFVKFVQSVK